MQIKEYRNIRASQQLCFKCYIQIDNQVSNKSKNSSRKHEYNWQNLSKKVRYLNAFLNNLKY